MWERFMAWLSGWPVPSTEIKYSDEPDLIDWADEEESKPLTSMSKLELEEYGRTIGIELDRRKTKAKLIAEIGEHGG